MKIGTFVMGGLAGAAIVMMIQRNPRMSAVAANVGNNLKHRMYNMKDDAMGMAKNTKFASSFMRSTDKSKPGFSSTSSPDRGMDNVGKSASRDSEIRAEIDSFMEDSEQHRI
ncbi:hypothetical protein [Cohnella mopanensis]|uniref:hypothetical protein n=1 Tax=Cohnella mopanensis TaxID=2911966 RepID=UPI001EF8736C|nr:hypothetical protein [Cohnella mopanensis]